MIVIISRYPAQLASLYAINSAGSGIFSGLFGAASPSKGWIAQVVEAVAMLMLGYMYTIWVTEEGTDWPLSESNKDNHVSPFP